MALENIGYYALPVIPSFSGMDKQVNSSMRKTFGGLGKQLGGDLGKQLGVGLKASETVIKSAAKAHVDALDKVKDAAGKLRAEEAKLDASRSNAAARASAVGTAEKRLAEIRKDETATAKQVEAAERAVATARERARNAAAQATGISTRVESNRRREIAATRDAVRAEKDLADAKKNAENGSQSSGFLAGTGIGRQLDGMTSRFTEAGKSSGLGFVAGAGTALLAGGLVTAGAKAAGALAAGFMSVVDAGVDFDKTMNNFQGVTQASVGDMKALREQAIALGGDTTLAGVSAADAANAMTELAKGGFSVQQSMAGARGALQLATAAQIDAGEAAKIESSALSAFGLTADDATHVADLLANVSNKTQGEITDFAVALQQSGAAAHGFGLTIDDTLTSLGVFAKMGMRGSDAGTSLKTMLVSLTDSSKPATKAFAALGVQAYDANHNFVGMRSLFGQLAEAQKRMTPEAFQASAAVLFGTDAIRGAMIAGQNGIPVFDDVATALAHQGGAAELAAAQNQGLPGTIENIRNTVDTMKLSLYDLLSGPLKILGSETQSAFGDMSNAINSHKPELIDFFTDLATTVTTTLGVTLRFMGQFTKGLGQMVGGIGNVVGAYDKFLAITSEALGHDDQAEKYRKSSEEAFGWGESLQSAGDAANAAADAALALTPKIGEAGDAARDSAQFVRDLGDRVKLLPDNKTITLKDNASAVGLKLDATKYKIETLPDGQVRITALTDEAARLMDAFRKTQAQEPIAPPVKPDLGQANLDMQRFFDNWQKAAVLPLLPGQSRPGAATPPMPGVAPRAVGGIFDVWKSVASFAGGKLPDQAMIQPPVAGAGLVQWAEPSTRGEAFIPLGGGDRSLKIWAETGRRLMAFDQGGFLAPDVAAAQSLVGTPYSQGARNDCSGMAARVIARTLGLPESGLMSTKNAAQWLSALGFRSGTGGPGQLSVGWYDHGPNPNDGHMAITLSNGQSAESGGSHGNFLVGAGAAGADSPQFDQHMFLPTLFGEGPAGSASGFGSSLGGTAGVGPNGEAGTYSAPDAKSVREADEKVADADARSREADLRVKELDADASESQKESAKNSADKAKREAADARADRDEVMKGKFTEGKAGKAGAGKGNEDLSELGSIGKSFLADTLGLGDLFPDPSQLGVVKLFQAIAGIKYTPQGTGFRGGLLAGVPGAMEASQPGGPADGGGGGSLPFGMLPGIASLLPTPGGAPMGTPASGVGAGMPPGPIDQSTNVTIQNPQMTEASNAALIRRTVMKTPRYGTYTQNPGVMGA